MSVAADNDPPLPAVYDARRLNRHVDTILRWVLKERFLKDGTRFRLRALRTPGGWLIRQSDLDHFFDVLTRDRLGPAAEEQAAEPSKAGRKPRASRKIHERLQKAGFED
jgi:hypothetical protein